MKLRKPSLKRLMWFCIGGIAVSMAMFAWFNSIGRAYAFQDSLFMAGLLFVMLTGYYLVSALGLFDLFSYGYNRIMASFRTENPEAGKTESYLEYTEKLQRTVMLEPAVLAVLFWLVSLIIRFSTVK